MDAMVFKSRKPSPEKASLSFQRQMSEAFLTAAFLSLSGGLQDAYTYIFRGKVFANAQTGNIILLSRNICLGNWAAAMQYLVPLFSFALGVAAAEWIRLFYRDARKFHWRQIVLLCEILFLFTVGFLPNQLNMLANALVSFSCAMQVQAFRKVSGLAFPVPCASEISAVEWKPFRTISVPVTEGS